ncbi:MAG: protein rep [Blastocatellia bacterium]
MAKTTPLLWVKESAQDSYRAGNNTEQQKIIALLRRAKLHRQADLLEKCDMTQAILYCGCGNELRVVRQHCRQAICQTCQRNKAFRVFKEIEGSVLLMQENAPGLRLLFLTFTVPSCEEEDLKQELDALPKGFTKLIRAPEIKPYVVGYVRAIEVDYNCETKLFHPHLHVLLAVRASFYSKGYLSQQRFLELWQKATERTEITQIKIKAVKPKPKEGTSLAFEAAKTVRYMLKAILPDEWTPESLITRCNAFYKRRQYEFLGDFKIARKLLPPYEPACSCADCLSTLPA